MIKVSNFLSNVPPLFSDLAKLLSGEITCSQQALTEASTDNSPYNIRPQAIVYPKNTTDIKHVISFSREYQMPITVLGGGTANTGGSLGEGVIIDMSKHFNHVRQINMMEQTITVDSGTTISMLNERLRGLNMEIPPLLFEDNNSTVGGIISTKSATSLTFYYGTIREWIEGITVIVDTGEEHHIKDGITPSGRLLGIYQSIFPLLSSSGPILRAVKPENSDDSTGYSIWGTSIGPRQLLDELVGSEGTLGIITSVTFRVAPHKAHSTSTLIAIPNSKLLSACIDVIKHHNSESIFMFDETFTKLTQKFHPGLLPEIPEGPYTLLITHRNNDVKRLHADVTACIRALTIPIGHAIEIENEKANKIRSFYFLSGVMQTYTNGALKIINTACGIIVSNHLYENLLSDIDLYMSSHGKLYTLTGYAGSGHLSLLALLDPQSKTYEDDIMSFTENIFKIVKKYKGGISAVGGDGLAKTPYLRQIYNEATCNIFEQLKKAWDPLSIFNPSKKTGGSTNYLHQHIARKRASE